MSLYSRLHIEQQEECPNCNSMINRTVQFAYGNTRLVNYEVGQTLQWGGNDVGERGHVRVRVSGHAEPCPRCGHLPDTLYEVLIEEDRLVSVRRRGKINEELQLFGPDGHRVED
jgi:predicted RNA-binding Zn-ribbon protein involved in translation (DUF1610 family)